jgi:alkanesulfonate monooxygenase SsuD/methylene tetrahydromethanopterin reductase-like flavin-dependent oxidoreductase (luciferase family)
LRSNEVFKADSAAPDSAVTAEGMVDDLVIWGTPDKVVDELLAFRETIGAFGTLLYASHDWVDKNLAVRSMELMVDKVMPALEAATRTVAA